MLAGDFRWYELMTRDGARAEAFYTQLFSWTFQNMPVGDGVYRLVLVGVTPEGGIAEKKDLPLEVPAHWVPYISVTHVDTTVSIALSYGAAAIVPPQDIPPYGGRFAILRDPLGAVFGVHQPAPNQPPMPPFQPKPGGFAWTELSTTDVERAKDFYRAIAGWRWTSMDMGDGSKYWIASINEVRIAGLMAIPPGAPPASAWLPYVFVAEVDADATKAAELGAQIVMPPTDIPGVGRFAVILDPTGAALALFKAKMPAK